MAAVGWDGVCHAYGPAGDVPAQLAAVVVGDDATRDEAWWNLGGNIHHQGTIYEATVPAVPILLDLAGWQEHPDRMQTILLLREIAAADGVHVWRFGADVRQVTDESEQTRVWPMLRAALEAGAGPLLQGWHQEPEPVQRALLWLLSVLPELREHRETLIAEILPRRHRAAWDLEVARAAETQDEADAVSDFADWVYDGDADS